MIALAVAMALSQAPAQPPTEPPAQPPAPARPAPPPAYPESPPAGAAASRDYRIGPGDILQVTVFGHPDMDLTVIVQPSGTFAFPLVGSVPAADATPQEVAKRIAARLAKGLIRDAQVAVGVKEYRSKVVFVMGEVSRPGTYPLAGEATLVEILARAGPLAPNAGSEVVVVRPAAATDRPVLPAEAKTAAVKSGVAVPAAGGTQPSPRAEVLRADIRAIQAGQLEKNLALKPGDTVFVPQAERIFVTGEVRNPGSYAFSAGLTVRQAVSLAGGFTQDASKGGARVVRNRTGEAKTIKLKLDDPVQPGDTVVVKAKLF
jgi:polysaccharide export outer membrane protein